MTHRKMVIGLRTRAAEKANAETVAPQAPISTEEMMDMEEAEALARTMEDSVTVDSKSESEKDQTKSELQ